MPVKIKRAKIMLFLFFIIALIALSACAKRECKADGDCFSKKCFSSRCENYKCAYSSQPNCCGNKAAESIEDGKPGNKCTCPADFGKCEGKGKVKVGLKTEDAKYLHYYCGDNEKCVLGAESSDIVPQNILDPITAGYFKASSTIRYNTPFDIKNDAFEFTITLEDASKNMALPIELTKIRMMYNSESKSELLITEQDLGPDTLLNRIGDRAVIRVPLNLGYKPREIEEEGSLRYSIDYSYGKIVPGAKTADGTAVNGQETAREKFTSPSKRVFLVRSE